MRISSFTKAIFNGKLHFLCSENYEIFDFDKNRYGGGAACYIRSDISFKLNSFLPNKTENITFDILTPHPKPITIGIIYKPSSQFKFLDIFEENLPKLNTSYCEIYFLDDFSINLFENSKYVINKSSSDNKNLDSFTKKHHEYCTLSSWNN